MVERQAPAGFPIVSDSQLFAAMESASLKNVATAFSGHSGSEAVGFCTFTFVRIISEAHGSSPELLKSFMEYVSYIKKQN